MRLGPHIHRLYGGAIVVQQRIRVREGPQHALRGFAGALGLIAVEVVEPATGMGVDQGQRTLFELQGSDESDQKAMLHDIGAVASMEGMAIIHWNPNSADRPWYELPDEEAERETIEATRPELL